MKGLEMCFRKTGKLHASWKHFVVLCRFELPLGCPLSYICNSFACRKGHVRKGLLLSPDEEAEPQRDGWSSLVAPGTASWWPSSLRDHQWGPVVFFCSWVSLCWARVSSVTTLLFKNWEASIVLFFVNGCWSVHQPRECAEEEAALPWLPLLWWGCCSPFPDPRVTWNPEPSNLPPALCGL